MKKQLHTKPDERHRPPQVEHPLRSFKPGAQFVRIFDHAKSMGPDGVELYTPIDFNPTLVDDKPHVRGRFSARKSRDLAEAYSYLYVGEYRKDERTAILECLDILSLGRSSDGATRILEMSHVEHLSFAYLTLCRPITLLDLTTAPNLDVFKAEMAVIQGNNYRRTRRWGRYFRRLSSPYADGLCYTPRCYASTEGGCNVVLFTEHLHNGDMFSPDFRVVRMSSREGLGRLLATKDATKISPMTSVA